MRTAVTIVMLLALSLDFYVYRYGIRCIWPSRRAKYIYWIYVALVDLCLVIPSVFFRDVFDSASPFVTQATMWMSCTFFINAIPKIIYSAISVPDWPLVLVARRRICPFRILGAAAALYAFTLMFTGILTNYSPRIERVEIASASVPDSFDGVTAAVVSDLHIGNWSNPQRIANRVAERINALDPDIFIFCGDLVNTKSGELTPAVASALSSIGADLGSFAVLGNHDLGMYTRDTLLRPPGQEVAALLGKERAMGWTALVDSTAYIFRGGDSISITGLNFPTESAVNSRHTQMTGTDMDKAYSGVPGGIFNITVSHTPEQWEAILGYGIADLTLSGHIHSMQMKIGFGRYVWSPAALMYGRWSGLYEEGGRRLYINDGLGFVLYPIRAGVRPEITLVTLRKSR